MASEIKRSYHEMLRVALRLLQYCATAVLIGAVVGSAGALLGKSIGLAAAFREKHSWIIALLPAAGILIVHLYQVCRADIGTGTNALLTAEREKDADVPLRYAPLIFVSTVLTHLFGGSAGRESAALQLGASLTRFVGKKLKFTERDPRVLTMCGMAAGFSALFGTPVAATIFALEILASKIRYAALLPVFLSAMSSKFFAGLLGAEAERYTISMIPKFGAGTVGQVFVLGIFTAVLSMLMCLVLEKTHHLYDRFFKNPYVKIAVGGALAAGVIFLCGPETFAGAGGHVIEEALAGEVEPWVFIVKLIVTALTLEAGFKGGEIVPTLFVGAAFGCTVGPLFGLDPGFAAACAMIGNFAGNTNCPLAAILLGVELFGAEGFPFFVLSILMVYTLSGKYSLYSGQKVMNDKFSID